MVQNLIEYREEDYICNAEDDRGWLVGACSIDPSSNNNGAKNAWKEEIKTDCANVLRSQTEWREYTTDHVSKADVEAKHESETEAKKHIRRVLFHDTKGLANL